MKRPNQFRSIVFPLAILFYACFLRVYFFSGFVLCDDAQEFYTLKHIFTLGPNLHDQLQLRFGVWIFNWLAFHLFGVSEFSFFLPTVLMSASFGIIGYRILLAWHYGPLHASLAGVMIASAPFEVLTGTLRANDLILSWFLAVGLALFVLLQSRPVMQGISTTLFLWLGFYVKLWAVYFLPVLGVYYLLSIWRHRLWRGAVSFAVSSLVLHGATCLLWKETTGQFLPFMWQHAATYPIKREALAWLFRLYPRALFQGSEFGTTLFGSIPYLLIAALGLKLVASVLRKRWDTGYGLDVQDCCLLGYYASFFLFLNFFPNSFVFDQYYSAPRIFRYLSPLSFPMTLHVAKLGLDLSRLKGWPGVGGMAAACSLIGVIVLNLFQTAEAVRPAMTYRQNLLAVVSDVTKYRPAMIVTEWWLSFFLDGVYLKDHRQTRVLRVRQTHHAHQYERWLRQQQPDFPVGTMLVTGIGSCVHYGAHFDGFRLEQFQDTLHPAWKLVKEYGVLSYLPIPETVRLWELSERIPATPAASADSSSRDNTPRDAARN